MEYNFNGSKTSIVYDPGVSIKPFQGIELSDSFQDAAPFGLQLVTIEVNDIEGGPPSDTNGTFSFTPTDFLKQIAPGAYLAVVPGTNTAERAAQVLSDLTFVAGSTPGTTVFTLKASDQFGNLATDAKTQVATAFAPATVVVQDMTEGSTYVSQGAAYAGPASVAREYIVQNSNPELSASDLNITAIAPNNFIHAGSGNDAIDVSGVGGDNVLDGATGSNFLTGGLEGAGKDVFFVDGRGAESDIWSTVVNFHAGDAVTLFGVSEASKTLSWVDAEGAPGSTGLTLHATEAGGPPLSLTLAGYTSADLAAGGRLSVNFGQDVDGTAYMYLSAAG